MSGSNTVVQADVRQAVISHAHGQVGNWALSARMLLTVRPVAGDRLAIPTREGYEQTGVVRHVTVRPFPDPPLVELHPIKTDSGARLAELADRGWEQHGGPWPGQQGNPE